MKLILRIRSYTEGKCDVWLIEKRGGVEGSIMHGAMFADKAEALAEKLGLPVEREQRQEVGEMVKELF